MFSWRESSFPTVTSPKENKSEDAITTGILSWDSKPKLNQTADNFDWAAPSTDFATKTDDLQLEWDDEAEESEDSEDGGISMKLGKKDEDEIEEEDDEEKTPTDEQIDIMAQQLKFVACLKILMEELSTLATGFEVDGE